MTDTIADLLALDALAGASEITLVSNALTRPVRWLSLLDHEESIGLYPEELVILSEDISAQDIASLIQSISSSGACALAMHISAAQIPLAAALAKSAQLPLIVLPSSKSSLSICEELITYFIEHTVYESFQSEPHHRWLQFVDDETELRDLIHALAASWHCSILVVENDGTILAQAGSQKLTFLSSLLRWQNQHTGQSIPTLMSKEHLFALPLLSSSTYLIIMGYQGKMPTYAECHIIDEAVAAIRLVIRHLQSTRQLESRQRERLVRDLIIGNVLTEAEAIAHAQVLGIDLDVPMCAMVGYIEPAGQYNERIIDIVTHSATNMQMSILATTTPTLIVIFMISKVGDDHLKQLVELIDREIARIAPTVALSWGVSGLRSGWTSFSTTYQEAWLTCQVGITLNGPKHLTFATATEEYRILSRLGQDPESQLFWKRCLGYLTQDEHTKNAELIETLEVYLATMGNISETARQMGLHRQTLYYRLQRIEELTGRHLDNPQDRFALDLSTRLYRLERSRMSFAASSFS